MTEAEQFLTELESYSKRAMMQPGDSSDMYESMDAFQGVANPVAHIAANSPDVVTADIDEILRLRVEVGRLEKEADWLATHVANALREPALIAHLHYLSKGLTVPPSSETIREAARKAVEEQCPKN